MAAQEFATLNIETHEVSSLEALDLLEGKATAKPEDVKIKKEEVKAKDEKPEPIGLDLFDEAEEQEEKEEAPQPADPGGDPDEPEEEEEVNNFSVMTKQLLEMGIFTQEDGEEIEIDNGNDFAARWDYEKRKGAIDTLQTYLQSKGDQKTEWFDAIFNKGMTPEQYMRQYVKAEELSNLDLSDEVNQERVVREGLKHQGFEPDDIDAEIMKLKNIGELDNTSSRYHKALIKREQAELVRAKQEAEANDQKKAAQRDNYKTSIKQILDTKVAAKEFDGIPLTLEEGKQVFDSLYNYKYTLPNGEYLTQFDKDIIDLNSNPELKVKVGLILNLLKKDPKLSLLGKKAVSKETNALFKDLAVKKKTTHSATSPGAQVTSWFK